MKKTLVTLTMAIIIGMVVVAFEKKEAPAQTAALGEAPAQTAAAPAANSTAIMTGANCSGRDAQNTIKCLKDELATKCPATAANQKVLGANCQGLDATNTIQCLEKKLETC